MNDSAPDERPQRRREYSGPASTLGLAALVVITVGALIWYLEFRPGSGSGSADSSFGIIALDETLNTTGESPAARVGRAAPDFELRNLDGSLTRLSDFRGEYVLVNFWASWCPPCRGETPDLQRLWERAGDRGMTVLGVNQQEPEGTARDFAEEWSVTYPMVLDRSGEVSDAYAVGVGLPLSFLVDPDGVILEIKQGAYVEEELVALEQEYAGS